MVVPNRKTVRLVQIGPAFRRMTPELGSNLVSAPSGFALPVDPRARGGL